MTKLFNWKWFNLVFCFLILPTKWQNWLLASEFPLYLPVCMKFMKPRRMDIKILLVMQKDVRTYAGILIYDVRLQVNVRDRLAKKIFQCVAALFSKKQNKTKKRTDTLEKVVWILIFFIASIKSDYGAIFSFPNKLKLDDNNICTKLLIREQKIIKGAVMHTNKFFKNAVNNLDLSSNEDLLFSTTHLSYPVQIAIERYKDHPSIMTIQNNLL